MTSGDIDDIDVAERDAPDGPRTPLWRRVHDALSAEIAEGRWKAGDRLPSEHALAERFGVNRHTLRRAMAALSAAGVVHVRRGAGAIVVRGRIDYPIGPRTRMTAALTALGRSPERTILRLETAGASVREAAALDLAPGDPVHLVAALSEADGVPVAYGESAFPAAALPGFVAAMEELRSVTHTLARCGVPDYTRAWTRLTARRPGALVARRLRMPEAQPALFAEALNRDPGGAAVEYGRTWFCSDRLAVLVGEETPSLPGELPED